MKCGGDLNSTHILSEVDLPACAWSKIGLNIDPAQVHAKDSTCMKDHL